MMTRGIWIIYLWSSEVYGSIYPWCRQQRYMDPYTSGHQRYMDFNRSATWSKNLGIKVQVAESQSLRVEVKSCIGGSFLQEFMMYKYNYLTMYLMY